MRIGQLYFLDLYKLSKQFIVQCFVKEEIYNIFYTLSKGSYNVAFVTGRTQMLPCRITVPQMFLLRLVIQRCS